MDLSFLPFMITNIILLIIFAIIDVIKFKVGAGLHNSTMELYYVFYGETGTYRISSFSASDSNYEQLSIENYHGSDEIFFVIHATDTFGNIITFGKIIPAESSALKLPEVTSPVDGASPTSFTATTDAFTVYGGTDTHVSTDWKVTSDPFGKIVLAEALGSSDLTSHDFTLTNTVSKGEKLYVWAQHNGQTLGASGWNVREFTPSFSRHGEVLYDTNGDPAAVIIGSYASGGTEPWNIRGRRVWLAVACMSKRTDSLAWSINSVDISTIVNSTYTLNSLNISNNGSGSGNYVSTYTTETQMDSAFNDTGTSDELTAKIIQYGTQNSIEYPAAEYCDSIVLADGTHMDLPSMDVLMRIYQSRYIIDDLDPTLASSGYSSSEDWWYYPWSSCENSSNNARNMNWNGNASNTNAKSRSDSYYQAFPALEIEV